MNLGELTSGTPATKPWLDIVCSTLTAETVTATNVVTPALTAYASSISFIPLAGAQAGADLLTALSPNSRLTIPANTLVVGDVYRLRFTCVMTAGIGDSAIIDFGASSGPITQFPILVPSPFVDVPVMGSCFITVTGPATANVVTTISGFLGGPPPVDTGFQFAQAGVPFDTSIDQTFTLTYTTATFASTTFTSTLLQLLGSGAA